MVDVRFGGGKELDAFARRMKSAAESDYLLKTADEAVKSMLPQAQSAVITGTNRLPARGGLARRVARTRIGVKATRAGGFISIKFVAYPNAVKDPGAIDRGRVLHFTFGHDPQEIQLVPPGWFTKPLQALAPRIRVKIVDAVTEQLRKV